MIAAKDPRLNAPPRISDLHGEERRKALIGRHEAYRRAHLEIYDPSRRQPLWARLLDKIRGSVPHASTATLPAVSPPSAPVVEAGRGASKGVRLHQKG